MQKERVNLKKLHVHLNRSSIYSLPVLDKPQIITKPKESYLSGFVSTGFPTYEKRRLNLKP